MKILLSKVYWLFWGCTIYYLFTALMYKDAIMDINIHDTYIIINYFDMLLLMAISYGLVGWLYWMFLKVNFKLIKGLTILYILITLVVLCLSVLGDKLLAELDNNHDYNLISLIIIIALFLTSKIVFAINTIFGLLKKSFC